MGKKWYVIKLIIICILISLLPYKVYAAEKREILFISSYAPNHLNFNEQVDGIKAGLESDVELQIEYMDSRTFDSEENEGNFYNLLKYKLSNYKKFDAIILGDDEALAFGMKYRNELFEDIPLVFLGIQNQGMAKAALDIELFSGVTEVVSIDRNIELIMNLQKDIKNIIILDAGAYDFGEFFFNKYNSRYKDIKFDRILLKDTSCEDVEMKIKELGSDDAILMIYPTVNIDGQIIERKETIKIVESNTKAAVYEILSTGIGYGSIGGNVVNQFKQGKIAGQMVEKILAGETPRDLYMGGDIANEYIFDYEKLKEHGIDESLLPRNSEILNRPTPFFEKHKDVIIPFIIFIIGAIGIIISLILYVMNRLKYEKEILRAKNMIEEAKKIAEDANRAKGHFISNISHELRTPVTVIMSAIQLLKVRINNKMDDNLNKINSNLKNIDRNSYRLLRLVNNIVDTTKVDSQEVELELVNINIVELVEKIVEASVVYSKIKDLEIIFDTTDEDVIMAVDYRKIERIILNLLSNAIKFSDGGSNIFVNIIIEEKTFILEIEDNGIGIDELTLDNIFNKFVQVDDTFTRKNEGCGIGLSLVNAFVEMHNGCVKVNSKLGKGTKFIIELPIVVLNNKDIYDISNYNYDSNIVLNTEIEFSDIYL